MKCYNIIDCFSMVLGRLAADVRCSVKEKVVFFFIFVSSALLKNYSLVSMAADQRRKRINGASIVGYGSREHHRTKRKNSGQGQNDLNLRSHISVEWDSNQKRVVAKREQIGISRRQMKPFVNFVSNDHKVLADVFTMPQEIFSLDNLSEVLSYEVGKVLWSVSFLAVKVLYFSYESCLNHLLSYFRKLVGLDDPSFRK